MTKKDTIYKDIDQAPVSDVARDAGDDGAVLVSAHKEKEPLTVFDKLAMLSIVVTLIAWIVLAFDGVVALIVAALAFVGACFGLKASRRLSRNVAITSIVASSVLMVVVGAFLIVIYIGLSTV